MSKYMQQNYHTCNRTSMHISVFLWNLFRDFLPCSHVPQLLKRVFEFCRTLSRPIHKLHRKSVLLLYNYTFFWNRITWSPTWFTTLKPATWLFPKFNASPKMKICHCWMCLRLWRQFPKRSQKCVWLLTAACQQAQTLLILTNIFRILLLSGSPSQLWRA